MEANSETTAPKWWQECRIKEGHRYQDGRCVWCDAERPLSEVLSDWYQRNPHDAPRGSDP